MDQTLVEPKLETHHEDLQSQVRVELGEKLAEFEDAKSGLRVLSSLMGIHEKTLKRLLDGENKPGPQTLLKIYRIILETDDDSLVIQKTTGHVRSTLKKAFPHVRSTLMLKPEIERELLRDRTLMEIYVLCGTNGVGRDFILYQYGQHGLTLLKKLQDTGVVTINAKGEFVLGNKQASLGHEGLKQMGMHLVDKFSRPEQADELGENYLSLYAVGLTEEAYQQWLKIEEEAFEQKLSIARDEANHGDLKVFTFNCTDKIQGSFTKGLH